MKFCISIRFIIKKSMINLFFTVMSKMQIHTYIYYSVCCAYHNKNLFSKRIYNHDFINEFKYNMQYNYINSGRNNNSLQSYNWGMIDHRGGTRKTLIAHS